MGSLILTVDSVADARRNAPRAVQRHTEDAQLGSLPVRSQPALGERGGVFGGGCTFSTLQAGSEKRK